MSNLHSEPEVIDNLVQNSWLYTVHVGEARGFTMDFAEEADNLMENNIYY